MSEILVSNVDEAVVERLESRPKQRPIIRGRVEAYLGAGGPASPRAALSGGVPRPRRRGPRRTWEPASVRQRRALGRGPGAVNAAGRSPETTPSYLVVDASVVIKPGMTPLDRRCEWGHPGRSTALSVTDSLAGLSWPFFPLGDALGACQLDDVHAAEQVERVPFGLFLAGSFRSESAIDWTDTSLARFKRGRSSIGV